ncbi:MAG: type II toxin-antitoxin system Phd/YefM family antitoxin [Oligoflexia bacterium]|nr:type II toxin-antitoxin system Phd/YefM family antitoxin [Oligoflexia bacterium]MBF0366161.1 type II toxin-antitoxin system Phd/YefM family antitoxin [Oligoflexia bacterium]
MQNTNPKQFRAELKDYLELAEKEPIRIQRRSGESYILLKEQDYQGLQEEIISLQRRLLGMSQAISSKGRDYKTGDHSHLARLKSKNKKK